jgi:hypothetical protein
VFRFVGKVENPFFLFPSTGYNRRSVASSCWTGSAVSWSNRKRQGETAGQRHVQAGVLAETGVSAEVGLGESMESVIG